MKVWIMNLKDNRYHPASCNSDRKFRICKFLGVLAIGWADDTSQDDSFKVAYNGIASMSSGDLVWTKNPITQEEYLCKITGTFEKEIGILNREDIGYIIPCEFNIIDDACLLQSGIAKEQLISRKTLQMCHDTDLLNSTVKLYTDIVFKSEQK